MEKKVGIGIIGTGFARKVQIPAFLACKEVFIASVASGSLNNAKATAAECGATHFTDNWRETVVREDVDLVVITTPPNLHREMVLACVDAGKHILCEKPMAMDVAEAEEMTRYVRGKGLLALIDHELRFQPGRQRAYALIRDGAIGKIRHARCIFQAPHRGDPDVPWNWWSDIEQGGGALGAIGSHVVDSFNWFLNALPQTVFCQLQTQIKERKDSDGEMRAVTTDDELHMILRYGGSDITTDATGLISISMTDGPTYKNVLELYGTRGGIRLDHRGELYTAGTGIGEWKPQNVELGREVSGVADTGFSRGFMEFAPRIVEAIRLNQNEIEHAATFEDGLRVQRVLDAARASHKSASVISI